MVGAACGGSGPQAGDPEAASPAGASPASPAESPPVAGPSPVEPRPEVTIPGGEPPATLQVREIRDGSGAEAVKGSTLTVNYVGVSWSSGETFDSSWDGGRPITFVLGQGRVIPGWDQGLLGMKEGGRRELVIPPDLAYGETGAPPVIGPGETLVFVVDLIDVS